MSVTPNQPDTQVSNSEPVAHEGVRRVYLGERFSL